MSSTACAPASALTREWRACGTPGGDHPEWPRLIGGPSTPLLLLHMNQHVVYCFLGEADTEDQKVFLWPRWERCFLLFDEILKPFAKTSFIKSNQSYVIPLKARNGD